MNKRKIVSMIAVALCMAAATLGVLAQGRYANVYSRGDVDGFIRNLETSSDVFSRDFKNTGGVSSTERRTVDRFENAVDRLRSRFNSNNNNWWQSRTEVQGIMNEARQVNVMMNNDRYGRPLESQWRNLRRDINKLADTYELPLLAGGNGNGGGYGGGYPGGGGGGVQSRPPNWAVGTWTWQQGPDRQFTIDATAVSRSTRVAERATGHIIAARSFSTESVEHHADGDRHQDLQHGDRRDQRLRAWRIWRRTVARISPIGGGGGNMTRPPSWAVGTWTWVQGRDVSSRSRRTVASSSTPAVVPTTVRITTE
jgi:hypothetical protein